jgi:hypothetical protein
VGGSGSLKVEIKSPNDCNFKASYIIKDQLDKSSVYPISIKEGETKEITVPNIRNASSIVFVFSVEGSKLDNATTSSFFVYNTTASTTINNSSEQGEAEPEVNLPFEISKPLNQMSREELLTVLLRVIVYLLSQGVKIGG